MLTLGISLTKAFGGLGPERIDAHRKVLIRRQECLGPFDRH
jgi:hypothetical protein